MSRRIETKSPIETAAPEVQEPPEGARPQTRASKAGTEPGIPRRTLARLIDRLESL